MGRREMEEKEPKAELVREICFISTAFASCDHISSSARKRAFVDWYLILKVDEDSSLDAIRRRYRQLALQLHPDKNAHPKAEVAFKLISEAYYCLSDKARRKSFHDERNSNFCRDCYIKWQSDNHENTNETKIISSKSNSNGSNTNSKSKPKREQISVDRGRQNHILRKLKQVQKRLREECRVIESCLKATMSTTGSELPLFDPYDPVRFPNYPYGRQAKEAASMSPRYCFFQPVTARGQVQCESPIYQLRSDFWTRRTPKSQCSKV